MESVTVVPLTVKQVVVLFRPTALQCLQLVVCCSCLVLAQVESIIVVHSNVRE